MGKLLSLEDIVKRFIESRLKRGMSVKATAKACGIAKSTLLFIESGKSKYPRYDTLVKISTYLEVNIYEI